jgi:hypothetical protein
VTFAICACPLAPQHCQQIPSKSCLPWLANRMQMCVPAYTEPPESERTCNVGALVRGPPSEAQGQQRRPVCWLSEEGKISISGDGESHSQSAGRTSSRRRARLRCQLFHGEGRFVGYAPAWLGIPAWK